MRQILALLAAFTLSGGAAVVFESLWFRELGLVVGSGVWAVSLVTGAFMVGLAGGNHLAGRFGGRLSRPLRAYALLELTGGLLGLAVVVLLPHLSPLVYVVLRPLALLPASAVRGACAFLVLAGPACAMGATLPLGVQGLAGRVAFGPALGALYGLNTAGAVAGAVACELVLVPALGIRGPGWPRPG